MLCRQVAVLGAVALVVAASAAPRAAEPRQAAGVQQGAPAKPAPKPKKPPSAKLAEPWPDAAQLADERRKAEGRRLFRQSDPLAFTLTADFKAVNRDRDPASTKVFPAVLTTTGPAGASQPLKVTLRTRGNLRLDPRTCGFAPLAINFVKKEMAGTEFDGQTKLKLVTHCQDGDSYEQRVLRELLVYRLHNLLTPRSFRVRLARATYVDAASGKTVAARHAFFIEDEADVARRLEGRAVSLPRLLFSDLEPESLTQMMLFQYLIGNTDFSIFALHNVAMVATPARVFYPIVWDFDVTGLVNPPYGVPSAALGLMSIRDRLYRGPCRSMQELEPALAIFRAKQAAAMALVDSVPGFDERNRRDVAAFLGQFFTLLGRQDALKRELVDKCRKQPTM
jgi:hypothetical protein